MKSEKYSQFIRFCVNGCVAVAIQYAMYLLLIPLINEFVANTIAYFISFCYNFIVTSYWTFNSKPSLKKLGGFGGSHILNYFLQQGFLALYLNTGVPKEYAAILAMGSALPINFTILHFIYKK